MKMTIDNAIEHIKQARFDYCEFWEETKDDTTIAYDLAIDIMRKYQKIEEIVEHWACCGNPSYSMVAISEVLEDGNYD